jgi:hypothetical protein
MSRSSDDLKDVVAALPAAQLPHLLDLMCIQPGGNATVRRQRILTAISGRPARQRSGWLDFSSPPWRLLAAIMVVLKTFLWSTSISLSWTTRITGMMSTPEFWTAIWNIFVVSLISLCQNFYLMTFFLTWSMTLQTTPFVSETSLAPSLTPLH